jgi:hypothetical protein
MTEHTGRIYALVLAVLVFFVSWAAIAAHPWVTTTADPQLAALTARERQLRREAVAVHSIVNRRWQTYRTQLAQRKHANAAARSAAVRVVTLPPLTITRTS